WASDFADLDNDGDLDCFIINHDMLSALYENVANDTFVNVTPVSGMTFDLAGLLGIQVIMDDFDNDGLIDILFTSTGDEHLLFQNLGNLTFQNIVTTAFPAGSPGMQSAAVGDVNRDGFLDILGGFANGFNSWSSTENILFINEGNSHHFLSVRLVGDSSHINGIGARIEVHGGFGQQIREIRSGESYGIMNSLNAHFGLGTHTSIDSLVVRWPSGTVDVWSNLAADQFLTVLEGTGPCDCNTPVVHVVTSTANEGAGSLREAVSGACPCDTVRFSASLDGDTITLAGQSLHLGKDLIIESTSGTGVVVEIGDAQSVLEVPPGISLSLKGLELRDASAAALDPMLVNAGHLTLENVLFTAQFPYPVMKSFVTTYGTVTHKGLVKVLQE
ncbi:MAG: CRTAC1 family protein, partial [Saprospiraceae bacterium]|nr:CRTAC1 family protein [Saprospiraceae bacterium]